VRAVNLLPSDLRRGGGGGGSASGAGAYALLGVLALAVVVVAAWAYTGRQVADREAEVTRLNAEAVAAETQAAGLSSYQQAVKVAATRRSAVDALLAARNDWSSRLNDVSRTVPGDVSLVTMAATAAPGVSVDGAGINPQRAANPGPAIEVAGCAISQSEVAELMSRLRAMKGVTQVGLSSSEKTDTASSGSSDSAASATGGDCTAGSDQRPKFNIVVFYGDGAATTAPDGTTTAAADTTSTTTTSGSAK
jgi:Tfp pilus assembly protein PilN